MMNKTHLILTQILLLGLIVWSVLNVFNAFHGQRGLESVGKDVMFLIVFLPIEFAIALKYLNRNLKSLSVEFFIKLIVDSVPLMLGLFILSRGITMYVNADYHLSIGQNVAPGALLISGAVLSLIGIGNLVIKK